MSCIRLNLLNFIGSPNNEQSYNYAQYISSYRSPEHSINTCIWMRLNIVSDILSTVVIRSLK